MSRVAAEVRRHKEQHPELYCHVEKCLWRIVTASGPNPCRNHPLPPVPPVPPADPAKHRPCNRCDRVVGMRVEVFTASQRLVVCAACAVELTRTDASARIVAHQPPALSIFVAADGFYMPNPVAVRAHQRELDAEAERFANRVRAYVERHAMEAAS